MRAAGALLLILLLGALGACSRGGHGAPQLTVAELSAADDTCPLDLPGRARDTDEGELVEHLLSET